MTRSKENTGPDKDIRIHDLIVRETAYMLDTFKNIIGLTNFKAIFKNKPFATTHNLVKPQ